MSEYKFIYKNKLNEEFPSDVTIQLKNTIEAVFKSFDNERAIYYRKINNIPDDIGTAVNIQEMVYGNFNDESGTGVAFSRNPATGENKYYGEYLPNAQGEDIVAGIRTPYSIELLKEKMPSIYEEFVRTATLLETHFKDMQDMEFTVENNNFFILQTRNAKRTGAASIKVAMDLIKEGLINEEEAIKRVSVEDIESVLHPTFNSKDLKDKIVLANGLGASPGAVSGKIVLNSKDVSSDSILVRVETSAEDIEGMHKSKGILTLNGGMTYHAAVVARGMGCPCVSGANIISIDILKKEVHFKDKILKEGDYISIDGTSGIVYEGEIETTKLSVTHEFTEFLKYR